VKIQVILKLVYITAGNANWSWHSSGSHLTAIFN
jgi:hypothetical protein